jgi:hypothetical protein
VNAEVRGERPVHDNRGQPIVGNVPIRPRPFFSFDFGHEKQTQADKQSKYNALEHDAYLVK